MGAHPPYRHLRPPSPRCAGPVHPPGRGPPFGMAAIAGLGVGRNGGTATPPHPTLSSRSSSSCAVSPLTSLLLIDIAPPPGTGEGRLTPRTPPQTFVRDKRDRLARADSAADRVWPTDYYS